MTTLNNIEKHLNIKIENIDLNDGRHKVKKNKYYHLKDICYIIMLSKNKWMIAEDCNTTKNLLNSHTWCCDGGGYARTNINGLSKRWHRMYLNYDNPHVADHINRSRFDNRHDNLRVVTHQKNSRNNSLRSDNISGFRGVGKCNIKGVEYWRATITDDTNKLIFKHFSVKKLTYDFAKIEAITQRKQWEIEYNYN